MHNQVAYNLHIWVKPENDAKESDATQLIWQLYEMFKKILRKTQLRAIKKPQIKNF